MPLEIESRRLKICICMLYSQPIVIVLQASQFSVDQFVFNSTKKKNKPGGHATNLKLARLKTKYVVTGCCGLKVKASGWQLVGRLVDPTSARLWLRPCSVVWCAVPKPMVEYINPEFCYLISDVCFRLACVIIS